MAAIMEVARAQALPVAVLLSFSPGNNGVEITQPVADERLADGRVVGLAMRGAGLFGIEDAKFDRYIVPPWQPS